MSGDHDVIKKMWQEIYADEPSNASGMKMGTQDKWQWVLLDNLMLPRTKQEHLMWCTRIAEVALSGNGKGSPESIDQVGKVSPYPRPAYNTIPF